MLMDQAAQFRRFRAPQEDGQTLVEPPWPSLPEVVERNRRHLAEFGCDIQGRALGDLAAAARRSLVQQAVASTRQYCDVPRDVLQRAASDTAPLVLSGHQPELIHPGVWYKNFLLGRLARRIGGIGIHLLIDSDLCRSASLRVPAGTPDEPRIESVPFDQPSAELPYEERGVVDRATLASFAARATRLLSPLVREPVVNQLWPLVLKRHEEQANLGLCLAQGRHLLEAEWGNVTLELPQSAVCQLPEFGWFAAHVLAHLPRFWTAHNEALADYRAAHHLRNRAQPVPDLAESDGWLEAPFWIWSADDPERRPLFARQEGDRLLVTDRRRRTVDLLLSAEGDAAAAAEQLADLAERGVKIRTRALATTLFARLCLSDLFLHGIGGAKYDQVTDAIAERFFGMALPEIAVVSATLRLPIEHRHADQAGQRTLRQQLRDLEFHPERFALQDGSVPADQVSQVAALAARKQRWIDTPKTVQNARQRHQEIAAVNEAIYPYVAHLRTQIERQLDDIERRTRASAIFESREYAFCLFPREPLQALLLDALSQKA
jgi:hypothetical protein